MKRCFCPLEGEIAAALREGRWPEGAGDSLRAHARECATCGEVVIVAQFLGQARVETVRSARLPSSGALWWRAQLHRRCSDVERATQPIALVEKLSLVCFPLVCIGLAVWQWKPISSWLSWLADAGRVHDLFADSVQASLSNSGLWMPILFAAALGTVALFGVLALYLLVEKD